MASRGVPLNREHLKLAGYFPKDTRLPAEWNEPFDGVTEICSVSGCINRSPDGWIDHWLHNDWGFSTHARMRCPWYLSPHRRRSNYSRTACFLMNGKPESMDQWVADAAATGIHAMKRFARTLKQDIAAVRHAVSEKWSNGPVEGHVNRLKTLKRQMYGRAGFELLRARVLPIANFSP